MDPATESADARALLQDIAMELAAAGHRLEAVHLRSTAQSVPTMIAARRAILDLSAEARAAVSDAQRLRLFPTGASAVAIVKRLADRWIKARPLPTAEGSLAFVVEIPDGRGRWAQQVYYRGPARNLSPLCDALEAVPQQGWSLVEAVVAESFPQHGFVRCDAAQIQEDASTWAARLARGP